MFITIVMEGLMQSTEPNRQQWVVEFNFAGCRIMRWAEKRRHLLGVGLGSGPAPFHRPQAPLPQPETV